ncbi:TPA: sensor histidine kinase [Citrobacter freundii]|uniref:ATP-binding protein n=1 Tax=Enterobacteriaceae TaxID=543 RepID=UPI000D377848|nr:MULTISPECIES: sensor histidine kinase [Enterobacteriaceae]MBJ9311337.1 sensor histidine kinase [Citrobacter freundii]RAU49099.1 GHKL domain-containing protein [Pseudocitrobacter sp. RIT 415]HEE0086717.1 sensor histidine kinase [Citrobacter freundii]HEI8940830.1 sensor histidine kinase [Citrobacter freundii]HEJ0167491.1 sensor histidine kinase [Citrobacter freundii]
MIIEEDLSFSVDGRLLSELGEKLVTKNYLALSELIKNSYDADSAFVEITLENVKDISHISKIIIRDEGEGMSWDDFKNNWMRISTSNKERYPITEKYARNKTGSKGIGRFACQKLSDTIHLETTKLISPTTFEVTSITIKWGDFKTESELVKVSFKASHYLVTDQQLQTGTKITLSDLKEKWNQFSYKGLLKELASLSLSTPIKREGFIEDPGFEIRVLSDEFGSGDNLHLNDEILNGSWGRLNANVTSEGEIELILEAKTLGKRTYQLSKRYPDLANITFDIAYFPDRTSYLRRPDIIPLKVIRPIREVHAGIKIYSEGFRVYPYGQAGDDWLSLDKDVGRRKAKIDNEELSYIAESYGLDPKRTMLDLFPNKMLIGSVQIDANNSSTKFLTKLNREGFVENKAFEDLKEALRAAIEWMTIQFSSFKLLYADEEAERIRTDFDKVLADIQPLDKEINREIRVSEAFKIIRNAVNYERKPNTPLPLPQDQTIAKATELLSTEFSVNEKELNLLRSIASAGPLFFVFAHEFRGLVSKLDTNAGSIEQWIVNNKKANIDIDWLAEIASSMRQTREDFVSLEKLIGIFSSTHKIEQKQIRVFDAINSVCDGFSFITKSYGIQIVKKIDNQFLKTSLMPEASFYSILVNLLSNAIKAVLASKNSGKRMIEVIAKRENNLIISISDNGVGLDASLWDDVFRPLVTDPTGEIYRQLESTANIDDLAVLGKGTGLGLNIVKSMVSQNKGKVNFIEPGDSWATTVKVQLP